MKLFKKTFGIAFAINKGVSAVKRITKKGDETVISWKNLLAETGETGRRLLGVNEEYLAKTYPGLPSGYALAKKNPRILEWALVWSGHITPSDDNEKRELLALNSRFSDLKLSFDEKRNWYEHAPEYSNVFFYREKLKQLLAVSIPRWFDSNDDAQV